MTLFAFPFLFPCSVLSFLISWCSPILSLYFPTSPPHTHARKHTRTLEMNSCKILQPQRVSLRESSKGEESSLQFQLCGERGLEEQNSRGSLEERKASQVLRACVKEMKGNLWLRAVNVIQNTLCPPYLHPVAIEKQTKRSSFCWPKNIA